MCGFECSWYDYLCSDFNQLYQWTDWLSVFTHPHVIPNPYADMFLYNTGKVKMICFLTVGQVKFDPPLTTETKPYHEPVSELLFALGISCDGKQFNQSEHTLCFLVTSY